MLEAQGRSRSAIREDQRRRAAHRRVVAASAVTLATSAGYWVGRRTGSSTSMMMLATGFTAGVLVLIALERRADRQRGARMRAQTPR